MAMQKDAVTRIAGVIMPEAINNLEDEIGGIFTIIKSTHFNEGQCYGYLACVISEAKYQLVIADNTGTYTAPQNPGVYAAAALNAGASAAQREQLMANHKEEQVSYTKYLRAQEAGKELILYGVGNGALAPLKKQYINSCHRVQLVRRVAQEPLVRGSNPSGARVRWIEGLRVAEPLVRGSNP